MTEISQWSTTAASNNDASPNGFPEGMAPSGLNDSAREVMAQVRAQWNDAQWFNYGDGDKTPSYSYVSATVFKVVGGSGEATTYHTGRRCRAVGSLTGTIYGTIQSSAVNASDLDVTVTWDSGSLNNETLTISISILSKTNPSLPTPFVGNVTGDLTVDVTGNVTGDVTGTLTAPDGSVSAPSITNQGDTNTGWYFPANNEIAGSTGGTKRFHIYDEQTIEHGFVRHYSITKTGIPDNATTSIARISLNADTTAANVTMDAVTTLDLGGGDYRVGFSRLQVGVVRQSSGTSLKGNISTAEDAAVGTAIVTGSLSTTVGTNLVDVTLFVGDHSTATNLETHLHIKVVSGQLSDISVAAL